MSSPSSDSWQVVDAPSYACRTRNVFFLGTVHKIDLMRGMAGKEYSRSAMSHPAPEVITVATTQGLEFKMCFWDTPGQLYTSRCRMIAASALQAIGHEAVFVFDLDDPDAYEDVTVEGSVRFCVEWAKTLECRHGKLDMKLLVGMVHGPNDEATERRSENALALSRDLQLDYLEVDPRSGANVDKVLASVVETAIARNPPDIVITVHWAIVNGSLDMCCVNMAGAEVARVSVQSPESVLWSEIRRSLGEATGANDRAKLVLTDGTLISDANGNITVAEALQVADSGATEASQGFDALHHDSNEWSCCLM
eukprot:TRINITY_DN65748_c0_g1_i1.p1 TRINITY_DN65748_c0_g1~~TRINITY_DN65748_c0_g1_i1.p1  ORF type:complete len:309 (+),score=46.02 TRINITY_DN65748_c0_g1_i1:52-978(+)